MDFKEFKFICEKQEVIEFNNQVPSSPLVSVCVPTYQHVRFIKSCLDGILMQKTTFKFEILIGEDESTDGTRDICLEYAERFPEKIKLFLHKRENNIKVDGVPTGRFTFLYNLYSANGKYIALCDGDDYWNDPLKLQKQVELLEQNSEYGLSCTACEKYYEGFDVTIKPNASDKQYTIPFKTLVLKNPIKTCTVMLRKNLLNDYFNQNGRKALEWQMGDAPLWLFVSLNSSIHFKSNNTAVYRILKKSATNASIITKFRFRMSRYKVSWFFLKKRFNLLLGINLFINFIKDFSFLLLKILLSKMKLYKPNKLNIIDRAEKKI